MRRDKESCRCLLYVFVPVQLYDAKADQFLADRFVTGTLKCGNEKRMEINVKMWINA
jgi:hypothetical protein